MKLTRQGKNCLFDQLVRKNWFSSRRLLRFTVMNKSNARIVRNFLNGKTIFCRNNQFRIELENSNRSLLISDDALITILKFLCPQPLKLSIDSINRVRLERLISYLNDVIKLDILRANNGIVSSLHSVLPQVRELNCGFGVLTSPNFPVLKLDKLIIYKNGGIYPNKFCIFRHDIKVLDVNFESVWGFLINQYGAGQASLEHLILRMRGDYFSLTYIVLPFVINYLEHFPKLKKINLKINKEIESGQHPTFGANFITYCNEIMAFKERVKNSLSELTFDVVLEINVYDNDEYQAEWQTILLKATQLGNAIIKKRGHEEILQITYVENVNGMLFKLRLKIILGVFEEEIDEEVLDDMELD